jgi:hypothetical protein
MEDEFMMPIHTGTYFWDTVNYLETSRKNSND